MIVKIFHGTILYETCTPPDQYDIDFAEAGEGAIQRMNRWINRYGSAAVLVMLLLVMNPELQAFLILTNFIGLDLMIFVIVIQLRYLLPAMLSYRSQMDGFLCVAGYTALRVTTRTIGLVLVPVRVSGGLTTLLFVWSKNMWCPKQRQDWQRV